MLEWNELKCNPPGDTDRLEVVTESAGRNRENAIGSKHRDAPGFEAVEIVERPATLPGETRQSASPETKTRGPPIKAVPLAPFVASEIPHRRWVISDYACRGVVTTLVGPGGMSKSTLLLQKALALATGRGEICGFHIPKAVKAWVWNQEDDMQEMQRRIAAIMQAFGVSWDDLKDEHGEPRLFISSGVERPLTLAVRKDHGAVVGTPQVDEIISEIKANSIGAFFADPLVEFHEADENSNIQMRAVLGQVRRIAVEGDCAALLSAHTRKPPQASSDGFAGDMDSMRGGGSQVGVVRVGATLFSMSEKDAKAHVIPASKARHDYVRLDIGKNNLAPKPQEPMWFLREGAMIGARFEHKGESVGYLRPVKLDRTKGGAKKISTQSLPTVLAEIMATAGMFERYVKISEVVATGTPEQAAIFGDKKNRSAIVKAGFDGRTESLEDAGRVSFRADQGREMTVYLMRREQLPKVENSAGSKLGNEEKSEA
jgi:hypothetical protein